MPVYKYRGQVVPIKITYGSAWTTLKDKGVDVLSIFDDGNDVIQTIMLNDRVMLDIRFHYLKEAGLEDDFFNSIEDLTGNEMQKFKEAFWDEVVNFSPAPARDTLMDFWKEAKKRLKSQRASSENMSSDSQEEQD